MNIKENIDMSIINNNTYLNSSVDNINKKSQNILSKLSYSDSYTSFLYYIIKKTESNKKPFIIFSDWDDTIVDNFKKPEICYRNISESLNNNIGEWIKFISESNLCLGFYIISHRGDNNLGTTSIMDEANNLGILESLLKSTGTNEIKENHISEVNISYERYGTIISVNQTSSKIKVIKHILSNDFENYISKQCDVYFIDNNPNVIFDTLNYLNPCILKNKSNVCLLDNFRIFFYPTLSDERNSNINLLELIKAIENENKNINDTNIYPFKIYDK